MSHNLDNVWSHHLIPTEEEYWVFGISFHNKIEMVINSLPLTRLGIQHKLTSRSIGWAEVLMRK